MRHEVITPGLSAVCVCRLIADAERYSLRDLRLLRSSLSVDVLQSLLLIIILLMSLHSFILSCFPYSCIFHLQLRCENIWTLWQLDQLFSNYKQKYK